MCRHNEMLAASTGLDYPIINEGLQKRLLTDKCTFLQYLNTFLLNVTASSAMESQCPEDKTNYLRQ